MILKEYGEAVLDKKIVACEKIRRVYEKLLYDIDNPGKYHFDEELANKHIDFIEEFCKQAEGKMGAPLKLEPFQKAKFQAVFGFVDDNGLRRYNEVLTIEGRKNGKTTEMAAVALAMLINDDEGAPGVYNIATAKDQANRAFAAVTAMARQSKDISQITKRRKSDLYFPYNMGTIAPLASNTNTLDGLNGHCIIIDELAAIKNRDIYDLMKQSMGSRTQPLLFCITTNGFLRNGIFDSQYEYATKAINGTIEDEKFLPFIYELDHIEEWDEPDKWIKANPGLGTIKSKSYLSECVERAKKDPAFKPTVLVKDFNLKQTNESAFLAWEDFDYNDTFDMSQFDYCIGGFDAADSIDLNAAKAICMRPNDDKIYVKSMYWLPEEAINKWEDEGKRQGRDNVPYKLWETQGFVRTCDGNKCDKRIFLDWFRELQEQGLYTLFIGYDPWHIDDTLLREFKADFGENAMIPVRQGTISLSEPMKSMKADLQAKKIIYSGNPIDKWNFANTNTKTDVNGNIQPVKGLDRRQRIDGTVALLCAYKVLHDQKDHYINMNKEA